MKTEKVGLLAVLALAAVLRGLFPAADPPWNPTVGIVWHDEGAWVHNARNKALFGAWSLDAWNPMFIAPVFTALEYGSFSVFGVGVRQARLPPEALGWLSVLLLSLGVTRLAGRRAGLIAAALLATNFVYVMWNRTALMEGPMVAFMVAAWYCYARAESSPRWGWGAGLFAVLAFFTKAAAAFFVAAVSLDAVVTLLLARRTPDLKGRAYVLASLVVFGVVGLGVFVLPNWDAYWFYNIQTSITRKPSYDLKSLIDRVTWFPILHDIFTRMWFTLLLGVAALLGLVARWREARPSERLLGWWIVLGTLELILHDVGNERRFVFFIPPMVALAAIVLGGTRTLLPTDVATIPRKKALLALPLVGFCLYVLCGAIIRIGFLYEVRPNVRGAATCAALLTVILYATWPRIPAWLSRGTWSPRAGVLVAFLVAAGQVVQYVQWAAGRTYENYAASIAIGQRLPAGTLVHGKLANGLSLENRIRPVFVGRGFGNYEDRKVRDDVRYILTYIAPSLGYESQRNDPVILDVLEAYPHRTIIMTFDVAETATGHDRAALIDKFGGTPAREKN
jgi:4-amino-4-deoxy-L-arabinose transferase-like glycosyltransferase